MINKIKNKEGGFLKLIIIIVVLLLLMNYFGLSISGIWNWLTNLFNSVR